jgi:hypothetical protein
VAVNARYCALGKPAAQILGQRLVLRAVRLIDDDDDVVAFRQRRDRSLPFGGQRNFWIRREDDALAVLRKRNLRNLLAIPRAARPRSLLTVPVCRKLR